ncbi:MAG: DUF805 domain-containing protein [Bradyrhizobium sp.]|jgi:uncharacterized membrane protein YhaH (DUF805 family)|uniref:DUF805 domain-containing protein n=1 Tax=Bradyrhizobium sp. TaxID=376 RepID=UPI001215A617|nr:DUF805 domain-containing protein [Bradyrhizobium sp.]THD47399.1 MAG: DUF805 domain-containing protein [Bradyrhizobium sp.]
MDYARLLFSFKGRINRARFLVVQLALLTFWFIAWPKLPIFLSSLWILVVAIVMAWINTATTAKRLHDRNWSGFWAIPIVILNRLSLLYYGLFLGLSFGVDVSIARELLLVMVAVAMSLLGTWIFIELYFLMGTDGPNRFGPDPLATVPAGVPTNLPPGQYSVPRFLVHSAGPTPLTRD